MLKVVIIGPESTGKSTLASALSKHFHTELSHEYARAYLETKLALEKLKNNIKKTFLYDESDFYSMYLGQKQLEEFTLKTAKDRHNLVIFDTDALTYKIWYAEVFKNSDNALLNNINFGEETPQIGDIQTLYLLCSPQAIVWQPDPLRENPNDRDRLFDIYEKELITHKKTYFILRGSKNERLTDAINIIESFIN